MKLHTNLIKHFYLLFLSYRSFLLISLLFFPPTIEPLLHILPHSRLNFHFLHLFTSLTKVFCEKLRNLNVKGQYTIILTKKSHEKFYRFSNSSKSLYFVLSFPLTAENCSQKSRFHSKTNLPNPNIFHLLNEAYLNKSFYKLLCNIKSISLNNQKFLLYFL